MQTIFTTKGSGTGLDSLAIFGAQLKDIKGRYNDLTKNLWNPWEKAMKAPQNWSKATLQEIKKVKSATKEYQESILKAISVSIDENSVSGKNNKDFISKWSGASSDDRIKLLETADKSMKDYLKTVDESGPTWEGFVKYQKNAAAQIEATGVESKLAAVGLNIFKAAAGMLVTVIAQFAIQKLIEGFQYLINIEDELAQKADEAREQYKSTTEELESQESALKKVNSQLTALNAIDNPTLADIDQTKELQKQNAELQAQIAYLKTKAKIEKEKVDKADKEAWREANDLSSFGDSYDKYGNKLKWWQVALDRHSGNSSVDYNQVGAAKSAQEELIRLEQERKEIYDDTNLSIEEQTKKLDQNKKDYEDIRTNLLAIAKNWEDSTDPEAQAFYESIMYSLSDAAERATLLKGKLSELDVNQATINKLEALGKAATTDEGLNDFGAALKQAIPDDSDREAFIKLNGNLAGTAAAFAKISSNGYSTKDVLDEIEKSAEDVLGGFDNLFDGKGNIIGKQMDVMFAGASDSLKNNIGKILTQYHDGEISLKDANKSLADAYERDTLEGFAGTVDEILGSSEKLTKVFDENGKALTDGLSNLFDEDGNVITENIDTVFAGASDTLKGNIGMILQQLHDGAIDVDTAKAAFATAFSLEQIQIESQRVISDFESAFGGAVSGVEGLINSYDELDAALKKISTTYDTVNSAIKEQNENGSLSIQTALELAKSGALYAGVLEVTENGIRLNEGATKEMVEAQINATKASVNQALAEAQTRLALLELASGMKPTAEAVGKILIPAFGEACSAAAYFGSLVGSISDGNWKGMFDRASAVAKGQKDLVMSGAKRLKTSLSSSIEAQKVATQNEIASLKEMQKMVGDLNYSNWQTKYSKPSSSKSSSKSSSSSSSSDDPRLKAWNEMLAVKKHQLEMDQITEEQYYAWLEANYKKQLNNQKKYAEEWRKYEEEIYKWKKQKRLDDWNEAVDLKKHELEMGKIDEGEYYAWLAANYKKYLNDKTKYAEEWRENEEAIHKFEEQQAKDSQDALEDLIDLRIDMLKQEKNNEKDVLKERQDNVKDFYDKQRDLLKEHYDQIDKEEERREKRKKVTDIQAELLELEADDSVEAQKRRLELEESLSDAKKDLNDFERDEELDKAEKMYDDLEEMQTQYYEKQIEAIEDYLDNAYELRQQAIEDLQNGNAQLYQEMIEYNRAYGDGIDRSITEKWEAAYEALNRYNSLLDDNYGMKLDNMTGYNKGKYETAAEREARERATQRTSAKDAAQTIAKNAGKSSGSSNTSRKSGPSRGDKVTIKKSATHFSSQSGNAKMASHVPGGRYTVYQVKGNQVLIGVNGAYTGWVWKSDIQGYATGTPYAKGGIANIDEKGLELILGSPDKGRYKFLNDGDKVFNAKASEFLYKWANQPGEVLSSMIKSLSAASSVSIASPCNITVGDVVINGSADEKTVGELRRAHKQIVTDILNEFKKMKK